MQQTARGIAIVSFAVAAALATAGCSREQMGAQESSSPQTSTPQAGTVPSAFPPNGGSPVTTGGNTSPVAQPQAADGPPGGPSGVKGSVAHPGASGGDVMPGTSGKGIADASGSGTQVMGNRSRPAQEGVGLNGGLSNTMPRGATTSSTMEGVAPAGSPSGATSQR